MEIISLPKYVKDIWQIPFDPELSLFKPEDKVCDKTKLIKAFPELEELISLPDGTKFEVLVASYTYTESNFSGTVRTKSISLGQVYPHQYQVPGYLLT